MRHRGIAVRVPLHRPDPVLRHLRPDPLACRLADGLVGTEQELARLRGAQPADARDAALTLLAVHDLHVGSLEYASRAAGRQHHPVVAELKWTLEAAFLRDLESWDRERSWDLPTDPVAALQSVQATDRVPWVYHWLAERASAEEIRVFLELEGGPDGGFDDLVAACQIGLDGEPKLELARNYWDEMGQGDGDAVHTELHRETVDQLDLRTVPRSHQPLAALHRAALGSTLATNRWLQPEMLGALGLIELQAGPRCRKVVAALHRTGAPSRAVRFYEEHARVDPVHGRAWIDNVVLPLSSSHPDLTWRIVRGARWRSTVNSRFMDALQQVLGLSSGPARSRGDVPDGPVAHPKLTVSSALAMRRAGA